MVNKPSKKKRATTQKDATTEQRWEDSHHRRTFYIRDDLIEELKKIRNATGESLSALVNEALEELIRRRT